jgi:hypothetical protein
VIENVEAFGANPQLSPLTEIDVAKKVDIDAVRNAGSAKHVAAFVPESPEQRQRECRRIEIAEYIVSYSERRYKIRPLRSAARTGAIPRNGDRQREPTSLLFLKSVDIC